MAGGLHEGFIVGIGAVGPVVASQIVPQIFHGIEFRGIRRKLNEGDVGRNPQRLGRVKAGLIPDEHGVHAGREFLCELSEESIDDDGIQIRRQQADTLSAPRTDARERVQIVILRLSNRARSRALLGPHTGQRALLSEARFVLEPDLDTLLRMSLADGLDLRHDVFLKASCAWGSAF